MAPLIKRPAPAFKATAVIDGQFREVSYEEFLGQWVILLFYPLDFTFVCPTELVAFADATPKFTELNTVVLGVSCDSKYSHLAWTQQDRSRGGLGPNFGLPLLADKTMKISRDYGVLLEEDGIALRGLFIIDPKGILRQITVNDLDVGRSVEETIRLVEAFQFTDEHGEVCPVGWHKGAATIKPDPTSKLEYFSQAASASNGDVEMAVNGKKRPGEPLEKDAKKARV